MHLDHVHISPASLGMKFEIASAEGGLRPKNLGLLLLALDRFSQRFNIFLGACYLALHVLDISQLILRGTALCLGEVDRDMSRRLSSSVASQV